MNFHTSFALLFGGPLCIFDFDVGGTLSAHDIMKFFMVARDGGLDVGVDLVLILLDENAFLLGLDYTHQFLNLT